MKAMRRLTVILVGLILAVPITAHKKAILIGVSHYPDGSGWCQLNSHNDVALLRELLSPAWDVSTLEDERATYNGIVSFLKKAAAVVSPGDTVLVHFSGHGQQMLPIKKDIHDEPDMLDEAIVPYDANIRWSPNYTGQNHLRDNEFGGLIDFLRNKAGVRGLVIVLIDACHSDSMPRIPGALAGTTEGYRGTSDVFGKDVTDEAIKNRFKRDSSKIEINNNASVVYLSACQANSRNAEISSPDGKGYGSLSYAVAGALNDVGVKDMKSFLDRVVMAMDTLVPYQTPGIRASFDYQRPDNTKFVIPSQSIEDKEGNYSKAYIIAIVALLALLLVVIWRMRR